MTPTTTTTDVQDLPETPKPAVRRAKKMSMERVMLLFTLFFVGGIAMLVLFPEEHSARAFVMAAYTIAMFWVLYRFAI